jgi:hypothetical protein
VAWGEDQVNEHSVSKEPPRRDCAIPPVIAVADQHNNPLIGLNEPKDLFGHGVTCPLL